MKRLESQEALFAVEIGRRDVSLWVMVAVIGFGHLSSEGGGLILSEELRGGQHAEEGDLQRDLSG